jgi:hypothetical protein
VRDRESLRCGGRINGTVYGEADFQVLTDNLIDDLTQNCRVVVHEGGPKRLGGHRKKHPGVLPGHKADRTEPGIDGTGRETHE